jgi:adenylate kinase family enzyme
MQRILVGGSSGAGKSTMARRLAVRLDLRYVEVDSLFHGPGWTERAEFVSDVTAVVAGARWVIDHDYDAAGSVVWPRLDTFVWLDYPRWLTEWRVVRRSLVRGLLRKELWNGNRESLRNLLREPDHPVRWSWRYHADKRAHFEEITRRPENAHVQVIRFRTPAEARRWLAAVRPNS